MSDLRFQIVQQTAPYYIEDYFTAWGRVPASYATGGVRYLPLPHPSGVSRWLNEPANVAAVDRAMTILRGWIEEAGAPRRRPGSSSG